MNSNGRISLPIKTPPNQHYKITAIKISQLVLTATSVLLFSTFPLFLPKMGSRIFPLTLLLFFFSLVAALATAQQSGGGGAAARPRELWCVAKNNAEDAALQSALDWACGPGGADCTPIQNGGPCYDASDLVRTASFAFNDYFLKHGQSEDSCNFSNTAALTSLNPSHNNCRFPSSSSKGNGNLSGPATAGSENADLTTSNSVAGLWINWGSFTIHVFFAIKLLLF
ncbi:hypothetical protein CDL12_27455 [Handroanthus impetiginosus]|uniref:X8 domain-containing protein n=1 Tax=Handroanthus impetiginosus TaxID=429701 RepID=A0A2G9G403_9LAMI|nr:hypothetical protein CDL12_27455 [Handroanthus impetiginosus]